MRPQVVGQLPVPVREHRIDEAPWEHGRDTVEDGRASFDALERMTVMPPHGHDERTRRESVGELPALDEFLGQVLGQPTATGGEGQHGGAVAQGFGLPNDAAG